MVEIFGKPIFDKNFLKKKSAKKFEKKIPKKFGQKKKDKFGLGFTVHLKSLPPPPPPKFRGGGWHYLPSTTVIAYNITSQTK